MGKPESLGVQRGTPDPKNMLPRHLTKRTNEGSQIKNLDSVIHKLITQDKF